MHPIQHAANHPDRPALIMAGSGETLTYAAMDAYANRFAHWLRAQGMQPGDAFAIYCENRIEYLPMMWGSQRIGTVMVPVSTHLTADETVYILEDSKAKLLVTSTRFDALTKHLREQRPDLPMLIFGGQGDEDADAAIAAQEDTPPSDQVAGYEMLYSSGTTGRPKGIKPTVPDPDPQGGVNPLVMVMSAVFGFPTDGTCRYLSPAPLYHAAPLRWCASVHRVGGTVVIMEKFDAEAALAAIETYAINSSQWVPTHFVRMLKLPPEVRAKYDLSTHQRAIHAAAPCPVPIKQAMIEWWGPIIQEYYAGSEGNGMTFINADDWLAHPGSVGRPIFGELHICGDDGEELPPGETGLIYWLPPLPFEYHNDPEKTASVTNAKGWTTLGDIGRVDGDGFLYLTDRKSNMIISGGVNIYPQEIENLLVTHPKVTDAAVIGAPDAEMGECVVAVVQPENMAAAGDALAEELHAFLAEKLARLKLPRQIDFRAELPREANGKLYKRKLKDEYAG